MAAKIHNYVASDLPEGTKLALCFSERWVLDHGWMIDDDLIQKLREHVAEDQIVELAILAGIFDSAHRFNNAFDLDRSVSDTIYSTGRPAIPGVMKRHMESLAIVSGTPGGA